MGAKSESLCHLCDTEFWKSTPAKTDTSWLVPLTKSKCNWGLEETVICIPQGIEAESIAGEKLSLVKKRAYPEHSCETEPYSDPAHLLFSLMTLAPLEIREGNWLMTEGARYCEYR